MYYIINQTGQVVAIDHQLLSHLNIEDANTFYKESALGNITVDLEDGQVNITTEGKTYSLNATSHPLSGVLGEITLISLTVPETADVSQEEGIQLDLDETTALKLIEDEPEEAKQTESDDGMISFDDIDLFEQKEEKSEEILPVQEETAEEEDELFELILPTDAENAIAEIGTEIEEEKTEELGPIYIDIQTISSKIGISIDDYNLFLNEYIDTALTFEEALQSNNEKTKEEALNTLSHLSNVLHLPYVGDLLTQIQNAAPSEQEDAIAAFFSALGRLTTAQFEEEKTAEPVEEVAEPEMSQGIEILETVTEEESTDSEPETVSDEVSADSTQRSSIDLSDVKPIHFDFQLEEAARDLSLPVELIEEFVNDFIEQAHEETQKMLEAYEKGDLETIQKIGHLLKGTSSNLRITPLSDTLYEIQFNEELDRVPELIKNYWGHFLSLENQIKLISK